jgi:CheY-like chemotaxis protein
MTIADADEAAPTAAIPLIALTAMAMKEDQEKTKVAKRQMP